MLVEEGANLDIRDVEGDSPMHDAVRYHTLLQLKSLQDATNVAVVISFFVLSFLQCYFFFSKKVSF